MSELLREIEEDIKRDRAQALWRKVGPWLISASLCVIAATASYVGWQSWQRSRAEGHTHELLAYIRGIEDGKPVPPETVKGAAHGAIASFKQAADELNAREYAKAEAIYAELAANKALPEEFQALATVLHRYALTGQGKTGGGDVPADSPYASLSREMAAWQAAAAGDTKSAVNNFTLLRDGIETPAGPRERARQALAAIAPLPKE